MNNGGNGAGGVSDSSPNARSEKEADDGPSSVGPILKDRLCYSRKSSRDTTPVRSPRFGSAKRQSMLIRENSVDLDSPRSCRTNSRRDVLTRAIQQRSLGPVLGDVKMSSVDLDEVEVFRSGPRTNRENCDYDQVIIDEEEVVFSASDLASGESMVFSAHIRGDYAEEDIAVDCGGCEELEIRVNALEHQIDALRAAVDAACAARKLGSLKDKKKSWTDRIFGCDADPLEERAKLICEMEPLLKAVNFMFRKIDEVEAKCKKSD